VSGRDGVAMAALLHAMARLEEMCKVVPKGSINAALVQEVLDEASKAYEAAEHASHTDATVTQIDCAAVEELVEAAKEARDDAATLGMTTARLTAALQSFEVAQ
jgi:rRNA maturation endonuclease Nob1